jgi:hypothetical protein
MGIKLVSSVIIPKVNGVGKLFNVIYYRPEIY